MLTRNLVSLVAYLVLACADCSATEKVTLDVPGKHVYVSYSYASQMESIVIDVPGEVLIYPGTYSGLVVCPAEGPNVCFESDRLHFCVPGRDPIPDAWTCNGREYERLGAGEISALGVTKVVETIGSDGVVYYFNVSDGLLGFKFTGDSPLAQFFISTTAMGFGAAPSAPERK